MTLSNTAACPYYESEEETVSHFIGLCPVGGIRALQGKHFITYYCSISYIFDNLTITNTISYTHNTKRHYTGVKYDHC